MSFIVDKYVEQTKTIMDILMRDADIDGEEISMFLTESAERDLKRTPCVLFNNYTNKQSKTDLVKLLDWYDKKKPIPCEHGVFFKQHDQALNLNASFVESFLVQRKLDKKEMFKCKEKGDMEGFKYYNIRQGVQKIFANSYYGVQGQSSSVFYNIFTALSVTGKGQSVISCAATTFEQFLCNNIKFRNMDDCLIFIARVCNEKYPYEDKDVIDKDITKKQLMVYLSTLFENRKDCIDNQDVLRAMINNLTQEEVNHCFFKNNIYGFLSNSRPFKLIEDCILKCESFMDPNKVPDEIKEYIDELWDLLFTYVMYNYPVYDRIKWLKTQVRSTVITVDTDSNFLNLEPFYEFTVENASFEIKPDDDDSTFKIVNIISYILGKVIEKAYWTFTGNCNVIEEKRPIINMKNEFLMSRILLTSNKKNYASWQLLQEGVRTPESEALDIKGLPIKKVNVNKNTREFLMGLLENQILKPEIIQTSELLTQLSNFEETVKTEFKERKTTFMSPGKANEIESYKEPLQQASIRASLTWNFIYPNDPIVFPAQINMVKVKAPKLENIAFLYDEYPEIYRTLKENVYDDEKLSKYGITYIGMPKSLDTIPEWILPLIDVESVVKDNLNNFLNILNSIGLKTISKTDKNLYFSNIIDF